MPRRTLLDGRLLLAVLAFSALLLGGCSGAAAPPTSAETPSPRDLMIYGDSLAPGWTNASQGSSTNFALSSPVYSGSRAVSVTMGKGGSYFALRSAAGVDLASSGELRFAAQASHDSAQYPQYQLWLTDLSGAPLSTPRSLDSFGGQPVTGLWTAYRLPLAVLGVTNQRIGGIVLADGTAAGQPTLYLDDLRFSGATPEAETPTPQASATPSSIPSATPTPQPSPTAEPTPSPTASPTPQATPTPAAPPTPEPLTASPIGGGCPVGWPVKVSSSGLSYDPTQPAYAAITAQICYINLVAALRDGYPLAPPTGANVVPPAAGSSSGSSGAGVPAFQPTSVAPVNVPAPAIVPAPAATRIVAPVAPPATQPPAPVVTQPLAPAPAPATVAPPAPSGSSPPTIRPGGSGGLAPPPRQ